MSTNINNNFSSNNTYVFAPINNLRGVVVETFNNPISNGSSIQLNGGSTYLNILGSYSEIPYAPTIETVTISNGSAIVTWTTPSNGGAAISSYTITSSGGQTAITTTTDGTTTTATVTGLTNYTDYTFTVVASNNIGPSLPSTPYIFTSISSAPTNVTALFNNGSVILTWTAPVGTSITNYTVTSSEGQIVTVDGTTTTATFTALTNGITYTFTVEAINTAGSSAASAASNPVTPLSIPNAPTGVTATVSNGSTIVNWNASTDNGGTTITSYTVTSSEGQTVTTTDGTIRIVTFTGLTNGTAYTFTVKATNSVGSSVNSSSTNPAVIPFTVPSTPIITGTVGNTLVDLSWDASASNGRDISSYTIERSINSTTWSIDSSTDATTRFKRINNLVNGTTYYFRVYATNIAGNSSISNVLNIIPFTVPSAPTLVVAIGNTLVDLSWNTPANNGRDISSYIIEKSTDSITWDIDSSTNIITRFKQITGLVNDTTYYFRVYARSIGGNGLTSNVVTAIPSNVPSAPSAPSVPIYTPITGTNLIGTTLLIRFSTTLQTQQLRRIFDFNNSNNAAITADAYIFGPFRSTSNKFSLGYKESTDLSNSTTQGTFTTSSSLPYIISIYFLSQTQIQYKIYDVDNIEAIELDTITITIPSTLLQKIDTFWLGRSAISGILYFRGTYRKICLYNGFISDPQILVNMATDINNNFSSNNTYVFSPINNLRGIVVETFNNTVADTSTITLDGNTAYLNILSSYIEVPKAPTNVTAALGANNDTVIINWDVPLSNGGTDISNYSVISSPIGGIATINSVARTATVSGLTSGTAYTFTVTATNIVGTSAASGSTTPVTPIASITIPNAPTGITATASNGQATINWTAPSDGGSPITSYTVTSSPGGLTATTANGTTTTAIIQGLSNGTAYTFTVRATNAVGPSAASNPTTAVTPSSSTTPVEPPSSSNLIFNFYLPGSFGISQDTELYIMDELSQGSREFHWKINCGNTLNELFLNRTYKQLSTNEEAIETNLSINNIYVNGLFNNVLNGVGGLNGNFIGLSTATTSFSQRLLEMAALKIFAHAKARAAIGNDSDFIDLQTRVITHLYDSFSNVDIRQQFFESYIKSQETLNSNGANDVDEYQNFNLTNSQIFIYGIFSGNILDATPTTVGTLSINTYTANMRIELCGF
jgi:hypothetical protein